MVLHMHKTTLIFHWNLTINLTNFIDGVKLKYFILCRIISQKFSIRIQIKIRMWNWEAL
jgi:hypothetical protein